MNTHTHSYKKQRLRQSVKNWKRNKQQKSAHQYQNAKSRFFLSFFRQHQLIVGKENVEARWKKNGMKRNFCDCWEMGKKNSSLKKREKNSWGKQQQRIQREWDRNLLINRWMWKLWWIRNFSALKFISSPCSLMHSWFFQCVHEKLMKIEMSVNFKWKEKEEYISRFFNL